MAVGAIAGILKSVLMNALTSNIGKGQDQGQSQGNQLTGLHGLYMQATGQDPFVLGISEQEMVDRLRKMGINGNLNRPQIGR